MKTILVKLRTVTPLFLGGAEPNKQAELRPPSIKGALRFWWRALSYFNPDREKEIFGSTEGNACFSIRIKNLERRHEALINLDLDIGYLGYGPILYKKGGGFSSSRDNFGSETSFEMEISNYRNNDTEEEIRNTLWLLCHLGGLGSRSRRGFGGLQASKDSSGLCIKACCPNELKDELEEGLGEVLKNKSLDSSIPLYSAFSRNTKILIGSKIYSSWRETLKDLGQKFRAFRSNWTDADVDQPFPHDYQAIKRMLESLGEDQSHNSLLIDQAPARAIFGLPHNYFFSSRAPNRKRNFPGRWPWQANIEGECHDRRASPLIFRVLQLADQMESYSWIVTYLKAQFLPEEKLKVTIPGDRQKDRKGLIDPPNDQAIQDFLDSLEKNGAIAINLP